MPHSTIDLGELRTDDVPRADRGWPLWERLRRYGVPLWRNGRKTVGRLVGGALATALVFTLTAGTPAVTALEPVFRVAGVNQVILDEQHLYLVTQPTRTHRSVLAAHRLSDGAVRWQTPLPPGGGDVQLAVHGNRLLVHQLSSRPQRISLLDVDTGELLTTVSGDLIQLSGPSLLMSQYRSESDGYQLVAVDIATGAEQWHITNHPELARLEPGGDHVVTVDWSGVTRAYDLASGALVAAGSLPTRPWNAVHVIGASLLLAHWPHGTPAISRYDLPSLSHQWTVHHPEQQHPHVNIQSCGRSLCIVGNRGLYALDPATGATRWTLELANVSDGGGPGPVVTEPIGGPESDLLLASGGTQDPQVWLVDQDTGTQVADLSGWDWDTSRTPLLGHRQTSGTGPTWVGQVRVDRAAREPMAVKPLALVSQGAASCHGSWPYVACLDYTFGEGTAVTVWRVRA